MPIRRKTPLQQVAQYMTEEIDRLTNAIVYNLCYVGERVRNEAVANGSYKDQTRHLRGSVGYVVVVDGKIHKLGDFGRNDSPSEAKSEGVSFAKSLVSRFPTGIVLIVVAGKNYAVHVSNKGYNVLDSAELLAEKLVPQMLKQLGF